MTKGVNMKRKITLRRFLLTIYMAIFVISSAMFCISCKSEKKSYSLNYTSLTLDLNETQTLVVAPNVEEIQWSSSNEQIALVENGVVTAVGYGQASVRASFDDTVLVCKVNVDASEAKGLLFTLDNVNTNENTLRIFEGETYEITPKLYVGDTVIETLQDNLTFVCDESIVKATVSNGKILLAGLKTGECEIYASYNHEGKTVYTDVYTLYVDVDKVLFFEMESLRMLTPKTLLGENVTNGRESTLTPYVKSTMLGIAKEEVNAEDVEWFSENESVALVNNGVVQTVGEGSTLIKAVTDYGTATINVEVSYPISSAAELDFLAMVTYTQDKETAKKYLGGSYVFISDVDYAMHTRNYILPIASVNHEFGRYKTTGGLLVQEEDYDNTIRNDVGDFALGGVTRGSYYSVGWKDVLGLNETTKAVLSGDKQYNAFYMTNSALAEYENDAEGKEFRGINPNGLAFTGTIDGNGYAIKNAFYMSDNMQGQSRNTSIASYLSRGYNGVGGFFVGYNVGVIENLELHVSVVNPRDYYYNNGRYSKTGTSGSVKINDLYLDAETGNQKLLLTSLGGINTASVTYSPHKGREGTGATGIVAVNNGILRNLYHNVSVYASFAESQMATQGVIASINGYQITNCVVNKFENSYQAGETTIATKTLNAKAGNNKDVLLRYGLVGEIKGSEIVGCYSLLKRDCTHASAYVSLPKAISFTKDDYNGKYFGGTIDEISKKVYSDVDGTTPTLDWNADYEGMYKAYEKNQNLDTAIWNISYENGVLAIALQDDIQGLQA